MQVTITGRHIDLEETFKVYVNEKLSKLTRFSSRVEEAHAIFSKEKLNYISEIVLTGKKFRMTAIEKDQVLQASFDMSMSNIERQLKRFRARVKEHKAQNIFQSLKKLSLRKARKEAVSSEHKIIRTESFAAKPMSAEEAALELELFDREFIVFRSARNDRINVLYRRKDGHYGLIET
jgi:putative sigma-54 modulation protein